VLSTSLRRYQWVALGVRHFTALTKGAGQRRLTHLGIAAGDLRGRDEGRGVGGRGRHLWRLELKLNLNLKLKLKFEA
jgi:hypothetical protein